MSDSLDTSPSPPRQSKGSPIDVWVRLRRLDYLREIPLAIVEGWTQEERDDARDFAGEWDLWISDICDWSLSPTPACLKPYLPAPYGMLTS